MKKVILFLLTIVVSSAIYAQSDNYFNVDSFKADLKSYNECKGGNKSRAKDIAKLGHMNDDKAIFWQYVIPSKDSINLEQFMNTVSKWQIQAFKSDKAVKEKTSNSIEYEAYSPNAGQFIGYASCTLISVNLNLKIEVKENRFRITGKVQHYSLASANLGGTKSVLNVVGDVFPFTDSDHKDSYAMAYINANSRLLNIMNDFLIYLNKNYSTIEAKTQQEDNW